jgi:hypothetical protein
MQRRAQVCRDDVQYPEDDTVHETPLSVQGVSLLLRRAESDIQVGTATGNAGARVTTMQLSYCVALFADHRAERPDPFHHRSKQGI